MKLRIKEFLHGLDKWMMVVALSLSVPPVSGRDVADFEGLAGRELAAAVRKAYAPVNVPDRLPVAGVFPQGWPERWLPAEWPGKGTRVMLIVPEEWTLTPIYDLYNLMAGDDSLFQARQTYILGEVGEVTDKAEGWEAGIATLYGMETNAWAPAPDRRGDIARRFMYMALMYPQQLWHDRGTMMLPDGSWPLLNPYAAALLAKWDAADPVDSRELAELEEIARLQGNQNPILDVPQLYDYLWGKKAGEAYVPTGKQERVPLKATYSRTADRYIDLYSPYVPEDAVWMFDGEKTDGKSVDLQNVPEGQHEISYRVRSESGRVKITVTK